MESLLLLTIYRFGNWIPKTVPEKLDHIIINRLIRTETRVKMDHINNNFIKKFKSA